MIRRFLPALALAGLFAGAAGPGHAQGSAQAAAPAESAKPKPLVIYFEPGSTAVNPDGQGVLDQASRLFREGNPIVMVISAGTDSTGSPDANLLLSQRRSQAVLHGLIARGLPTGRFQLLAKGETEPAVPSDKGVPEAQNRRVEISWR